VDEEKYYVYKYYINDELLYVGRTNDFIKRFKQHLNEDIQYNNVTKIAIATFFSSGDMMLYEKYYITKFHPPLNKVDMQFTSPTFILPEPEWNIYTREEFNNLIIPKNNIKKEKEKEKEKEKSIIKPIISGINIPDNISLSWFKQFDMNTQKFIYKNKYEICFITRYEEATLTEKKTMQEYDKNWIISYWCDIIDKKINKISCPNKNNCYDLPWMSLIIKENNTIIIAHSLLWIDIYLKDNEYYFGEIFKNQIINNKGEFCLEQEIKEYESLINY